MKITDFIILEDNSNPAILKKEDWASQFVETTKKILSLMQKAGYLQNIPSPTDFKELYNFINDDLSAERIGRTPNHGFVVTIPVNGSINYIKSFIDKFVVSHVPKDLKNPDVAEQNYLRSQYALKHTKEKFPNEGKFIFLNDNHHYWISNTIIENFNNWLDHNYPDISGRISNHDKRIRLNLNNIPWADHTNNINELATYVKANKLEIYRAKHKIPAGDLASIIFQNAEHFSDDEKAKINLWLKTLKK